MADSDERLARVEARLDMLFTLLDQFDKRFSERFNDLSARITSLETMVGQRLTAVENRLIAMENRFTTIEARLDKKASNWIVSFCAAWVTTVIGAATALIKLWP